MADGLTRRTILKLFGGIAALVTLPPPAVARSIEGYDMHGQGDSAKTYVADVIDTETNKTIGQVPVIFTKRTIEEDFQWEKEG